MAHGLRSAKFSRFTDTFVFLSGVCGGGLLQPHATTVNNKEAGVHSPTWSSRRSVSCSCRRRRSDRSGAAWGVADRAAKNRSSAASVVTRVPPTWTYSSWTPRRPRLHQRCTVATCRRRPPRRLGSHLSLVTSASAIGCSTERSMHTVVVLRKG